MGRRRRLKSTWNWDLWQTRAQGWNRLRARICRQHLCRTPGCWRSQVHGAGSSRSRTYPVANQIYVIRDIQLLQVNQNIFSSDIFRSWSSVKYLIYRCVKKFSLEFSPPHSCYFRSSLLYSFPLQSFFSRHFATLFSSPISLIPLSIHQLRKSKWGKGFIDIYIYIYIRI